ncbi:hypothetical protein, partial [Pseudobacillus badius]
VYSLFSDSYKFTRIMTRPAGSVNSFFFIHYLETTESPTVSEQKIEIFSERSYYLFAMIKAMKQFL